MAPHKGNDGHDEPDASTRSTTDINEIMRWTKERGGTPAIVQHNDQTIPILRLDFGEKEESLKAISWEEFKQIFESRRLNFLYQERVRSGGLSRFFKFVSR